MAGKAIRESLVKEGAESNSKPSSRVTLKHITSMREAMDFATNNSTDGFQRLGYLSFAIAGVLKDVGYPEYYEEISKRMWANYGQKAE